MREPLSPVSLTLFSTLVVAATTVALSWFAGVQLFREKKRDEERRRAADARISAVAYALRRELRAMRAHEDLKDRRMETWGRAATRGLNITERRLHQLMALAADASATIAQALREAYVAYYAAANRVNYFAETPYPYGADEKWAWLQEAEHVEADLDEALAALERVIEPQLILAEQRLVQRRRDKEV
jgi:hypothetical protein